MLLPFILTFCTKYKEEAPFFDGLFLEYKLRLRTVYEVDVLDNKNYKITIIEKDKSFGKKTKELFVDTYGKIYKSYIKDSEGDFSPIWIPIHEMDIGSKYNDGFTVIRKDKWKKWDVFVVQNPDIDEEQYFEINTGYLVGVKGHLGKNYEIILNDTNADIPTLEE